MNNTNENTKANSKYKDSLFRKLFGENKTNALSLYNALNNSSYTNEEDLEFTTLEVDETGEFEWTATMVNINVGHNRAILEKCRVLEEYSIFVQRVREYNKTTKDLTDAINKAVNDCIKDNILKNILESQKKEGINVVLTEFDEEKFETMLREEGRQEGRMEGEFIQLCKLVSKKILPLDIALQESNLSEAEFLERMNKLGVSIE